MAKRRSAVKLEGSRWHWTRWIEYGPDGVARCINFSPTLNEPDFGCRWLCALCLADTGFASGGDDRGGGYCGKCGRFFEKAVRDREPYIIKPSDLPEVAYGPRLAAVLGKGEGNG